MVFRGALRAVGARRFGWAASLLFAPLAFGQAGCSGRAPQGQSDGPTGETKQAVYVNGGFEDGTSGTAPPSWTVTPYYNNGITDLRPSAQSRASLNLQTGGSAQTQTVYSASGAETLTDALLGTNGTLRVPKFGNSCAYVNMNPGSGNNVNSLKQTMKLGVSDVDPADGKIHIRFAVAPVLQSGGHGYTQQPYYWVGLTNKTNGKTIFQDFNSAPTSGMVAPWSNYGSYYYMDWSVKDISPTSAEASLSDDIELEVIASGCSQGGHTGRIYVDGVGMALPTLFVTGSGPASANDGTNITYNFIVNNGGITALNNVTVDLNTPTNTTFQSASAMCTGPGAGSTGAVSCSFGSMAPQTSQTFSITLGINSGVSANTVIWTADYGSSATGVSRFLGSPISTVVTNAQTYADLQLTMSNGVGAVSTGDTVTYTIVATNAGPSAVTGATVTDTIPSNLTGVTWSCAGSGGGSCTANGSGSISDTSVNLPVGATATYTLTGTVGTGSPLTNTASIDPPSGIVDPKPSNSSAGVSNAIGTKRYLSIVLAGNSSVGSVMSIPTGISCGANCTHVAFADGATVMLVPKVTGNDYFQGWSGGGCTGSGTCTMTVTADTTVTATFINPPSCAADTTCTGQTYCDGKTLTCRPKLVAGISIPSDTIHDGTCTSSNQVVCMSGACNSPANTCATAAVGSVCQTNSDCTSNSCKHSLCVAATNGCSVDADCTNQYCDGPATYTCKARLATGAAMPTTDGLHTGCNASDAAAVCASGLCDATTTTCAAANAATCSSAAECVSNTCTSGHCVPASAGCWVDADCASGTDYCNRSTLTCTAKLGNGTAIPSDGLHTAICNDAAAVCSSGQCDSSASPKTCAAANGSACTAAAQCVNNACTNGHCVAAANGCWADGDCASGYCNRATVTCTAKLGNGTAIPNDGLHGGTCTDAASVCASGTCDSTTSTCAAANGSACTAANQCVNNTCASSHCVPASGGCWVDGDCTSGTDYCNRTTLTCAAKLGNGTTIPSDGLHGGTCTDAANVCASGTCDSSTSTCAAASGSACTAANQCVTNTCTSGHCVLASSGCWVDGDCASGYCNRSTFACTAKLANGTTIPRDGLHTGACTDAANVCVSGTCDASSSTCAAANGTTCTAANQCVSNACTSGHCVPATSGCYVDSDCATGSYCNRSTLSCTSKLGNGTAIPSDGLHTGVCTNAAAVCQSGTCNETTVTCAGAVTGTCSSASECVNNTCAGGKCGLRDGDKGCSQQDAATLCQSGVCASSGYCVPPSGTGCYVDSDCSQSTYCKRDTLTCTAKLTAGTSIPSDGLHDGTCTTPTAQAVCATSLCNTTTSSCADSNGATCTKGAQCVSNICGSNGKCGTPDGSGPCTTANARTVCQSGLCSATTNLCVAAAQVTCALDSDCSAAQFCNSTTGQCTSDLANGEAIPTDTLHSGLCKAQVGADVCQSGACSTSTNKCAKKLGDACTTGAECAAGVCGSNGTCGAANGQGPCTTETQASVCQSGICSTAGTCIAQGTCAADSDCADPNYCNGTTHACASRLASGQSIPTDGIHNGTCPSSKLSPVCASGACATTTNTCVVANGEACTANNQCASGTCGSNGRCGQADGSSGCTVASDCQSGVCGQDGNCTVATACTADANCGSGTFCRDGACSPQLIAGEAIPNDALHAGQCTDANALAVCVSSACNATTKTCASGLNTSCSIAAQCASGACGANGKCGYSDGTGPCTASDAAKVCQHGTCSATFVCIPSNGCASDAECSSGAYCDGATFTCTQLVAAGSPIPNDGLHDGTCTAGNARVCTTGVCNPATSTCAQPNGSTCTVAEDCATSTCAADGKCGLANGAGPCTPSNAALCRSGVCSASALVCIPSGGCGNGNDCASSEYCQASTFTCTTRVANGQPIPADVNGGACPASHILRACTSGTCNPTTNTCGAAIGAACTSAADCVADACDNQVCGVADGGTCAHDASLSTCQSGVCGANDTCTASSTCSADTDCAAGSFCSSGACKAKLSAGTSLPSDGLHDGACTKAAGAAVCASGLCNDTTSTCAGDLSAPCAAASDCAANACGSDGLCGLPTGEGICSAITATTVCRTGKCSAVGVCIPADTAGCAGDGDCLATQFCDKNAFTCRTKLVAGASIPDDGLHGGTCTPAHASAVCLSGACNLTANTCAAANGATCAANAECTTNVCGSNQKCGIAEGDGPCSTSAAAICQTGVCSVSGTKCITASTGCAVDADCSDSAYCDPTARTCKALLANGVALPADSLHGGTCSKSLATAVCSSGACNATANTCAGANGTACDSAGECSADVCGANSKCGLSNGESGCTTANASTVCQSGACNLSGLCAVAPGCDLDADCPAGDFCDAKSRACAAKLAEGLAIPKDALHDGTCSPTTAAVICASGLCNTAANTCAALSGAACTDANQCVTAVCAGNGRCGLVLGDATCTSDADCQSARCDETKHRCIASSSGCAADAACADGQYCSTTTWSCAARLADGAALPSDSLHSGVCNTATATEVCASGACNPTTNTCAGTATATCTADALCASGLCASNGKCGGTDGKTACSQSNAALECQSATCQTTLLRCVAVTSGCRSDSDCTASDKYCDGTTLACVARLTVGTVLIADGLHVAGCTSAAAECVTSACNAETSACALTTGSSCASNADCASNLCVGGVCSTTRVADAGAAGGAPEGGVAEAGAGDAGAPLTAKPLTGTLEGGGVGCAVANLGSSDGTSEGPGGLFAVGLGAAAFLAGARGRRRASRSVRRSEESRAR